MLEKSEYKCAYIHFPKHAPFSVSCSRSFWLEWLIRARGTMGVVVLAGLGIKASTDILGAADERKRLWGMSDDLPVTCGSVA